ncbi:serine/threonine-protein kinase [Dactylosporangium sucinum]|nr:serine/threonine-protein kinase [Dactylosporangium sucinum]
MGDSPAPLRAEDPPAVGAYRLRGVLGIGGMGTVYLAASPAGRDVALKVINPALHGDPAFRHRFAAEAAAAARVAGFCTARVLDVDLDGPVPHLVTEYVPGPSLHDYATAHGPLAGQVPAVAVGVAAALTAIHAVGLVHADLSPRNVLLSPFGPKVIDFGVARLHGHTAPDQHRFGTPGWLAPEQLHGAAPSQASDVYAWGLLVAWAGTGRMPVDPSVPGAAADLAGLDEDLAAVVAKALRADPAARPSAERVLLALVGQRDPAAVRVPSPDLPAGLSPDEATSRLSGVAGNAPTARHGAAGPAAHGAAGTVPAGRGGGNRAGRGGPGGGPVFVPGAAPVSPRPVSPTMVDRTGQAGASTGFGARFRSRPLPPVPPPPRRPPPPRAGRAVLSGIGLVALLACVLGALKLTGDGDGDGDAGAPGGGGQGTSAAAKPSPKRSPVAADGKLRFTVAGLSCGTTELGPWPVTKQSQGQFCLVELKVENVGSGSGRVWLGSQHLRDVDAREYSPDELSWIYFDKTRPLLAEINPGNSVTGTLVYDVPKGVRLAELRVKEHPLSGGETINLR